MADEKKSTEKKQLTDEQRTAAAERMRKARAAKKSAESSTGGVGTSKVANVSETQTASVPIAVPNEQLGEPVEGAPLYDEATMQRMIDAALAKQQATMTPQVIHLTQDSDKVLLRWQAPVADYNVLDIGDRGILGRITGATGTAMIPKSELSRVLTEQMRHFIDNRWMIVVSGLDDEERDALNCAYKEGELLDKRAFSKMIEMGDEMLDLFPALCTQHKEMVARRYKEAYDEGRLLVSRDTVLKLNEMSKADYAHLPDTDVRKRGMLIGIIEAMNQKDAGTK